MNSQACMRLGIICLLHWLGIVCRLPRHQYILSPKVQPLRIIIERALINYVLKHLIFLNYDVWGFSFFIHLNTHCGMKWTSWLCADFVVKCSKASIWSTEMQAAKDHLSIPSVVEGVALVHCKIYSKSIYMLVWIWTSLLTYRFVSCSFVVRSIRCYFLLRGCGQQLVSSVEERWERLFLSKNINMNEHFLDHLNIKNMVLC